MSSEMKPLSMRIPANYMEAILKLMRHGFYDGRLPTMVGVIRYAIRSAWVQHFLGIPFPGDEQDD